MLRQANGLPGHSAAVLDPSWPSLLSRGFCPFGSGLPAPLCWPPWPWVARSHNPKARIASTCPGHASSWAG